MSACQNCGESFSRKKTERLCGPCRSFKPGPGARERFAAKAKRKGTLLGPDLPRAGVVRAGAWS